MPLFSDYSMYNYSPPFSPPFYSPTFSNLPSSGASGSGLGGFRGYPSSSFGYPSTSSTGYLPTSSSSPLSQSNFVVSTARNLAAGSSRGYMPHLSSISESPPSPSSLYGRDISPRNIVSKSKLSPHHHYRSKPNFRSTDSIDVSLSRGRKTGNTPAYGGKIQRGRTVVRIQTLRTKDSPGGGNKAKRKTPGERLVEKFLIRDKENDEKSGTWNEMNRNKRNSIKRYISVKKKNSIPSEEKEPPMPSTSLKPEEAAAFRRPSISEAMLREEEAWFDNLILEEMKTADLPGKPRRSSSGDVCPMLERSLSLEDEAPKVSSTRRKSEPKLFLSHKNKFYIRLPSAKDDGSAEDLSLQQLKDGTKRLAARGKKDNVAMMLPTLHEQLPTLDEQSPTLDERVNRTDVTMRATPGDLESDAASDGKKPRLVFTVTDVEIEESLPQSPRKRAPKLVGYEVTVTEDPLSEPNMVVTASERDINSVPQQKSGNVIDEPGLVYRNDVKKKPARNVTTEINVEGSSEFTNSEETKKDVCLKVNGGPEVSAGNTVETKKDGLKNVSVNAVLSKNNHTEKLDEHEQNVALESKSKPIIKISNKKEALNTKNRAKSPSNFNKISETTNSMANDVKYGKDSFARENKLCLNAKKEGTDMDSNILSNFNATEVNPKLKFNHTDVKHKLNLNSTEVKNEQKMSPLNVSKNTDPANSELKNGKTESLSPTQSNKLSAESKLVENTSGMKNKEKVTSAESKPKGEPELKDLNVKLEAHGLNSRPKDKSIDTNSKPNFISTEDKMKQAQLALNLSNNQEPPKLEALNVKEKTGSPISESKLDEMSVNIVGDRGKKNTNVKLEVMKPKHAPKTVETNRLELKKGDPKAADKGLKLDLVQDKSKSPTVDLLEELKGSMQTAGPKKVNDQVLISNLNGSKEIDHSRGVEPKICDDNSDNKTLHADAKSTDRAQKIAESEIKGNTSASTLVPKSNEVKEQINLEILNENALTKEKNFSNTEQQNLQNDISIKTNNMNKTLAAQKIEEDAVENLKGNKTIEEKTQLKLNLSANSKDLNSEAANQQPELMGKKVGAKKKKNIVNKITDKIGLTKNETEVTCCVPDKNKILGKNDKLQGATDLLKEKDGKLGAQSELDIIDKFTGINELSKTEADSNEFYHKKVAAESNDETSIEEKGQKTETKLESGSKESEPKTGSESDLVEDERQRPGNLNKFKKSGTIMKQKLTADKQKNKKGKKVTIVEKLVKKSRNLKNSVSVSKRDKTAIKSAVSAKLDKTSDASDGKEENDDGLGSVKSVSEKVGSASEETNSDESSKDESSSQDEKEEEESSGDESDDESSTCSSKSSRDQGEVKKRYGNRKSTSSEDSGFESLPPSSPAGNFNDKEPREPGSPTRHLSNAALCLDSDGADTGSSSSGSTRSHSHLLYSSHRTHRGGRVTPPATTIPRFRKYCIDDFNFLKLLGKGSFGKVLLAELKGTTYYYAVKCLKKDVVLEDDDVECTLIERKVLTLGTKHPYLCHLFCTFQTESHLFFVMEYLNGGDLMFHIQQTGCFDEGRARFYAAEITSGLKFLHKKGIVYRDLKLDNVLLDFDGHVRIADFGMCKLQIYLDRTADTFCGTPDYMAPEIIKGLKYNWCVDWWSFGILLYEMLIGQSPFSGCDEDDLFWSICNEQPQYPRYLSVEAKKILQELLEKDAIKRLGSVETNSCGDVQDHVFFRGLDWDKLERRELAPPYKPRVTHKLDIHYCDKALSKRSRDRAKLTPMNPAILKTVDQTVFQGFSFTNPYAPTDVKEE